MHLRPGYLGSAIVEITRTGDRDRVAGLEQAPHAETRRTAPPFEEGAAALHLFKYSSSEALIPIHKPQNSHMEFQ
jgi:hypothetical protein